MIDMIDQLSIVIPALNEEYYLPLLLESIVNQNFQGKLQVIIVDGESEDKTVQVSQHFNQQISDLFIIRTKRGTGYQRNRGAEKAKYKYLLFLDADMILSKNLLNKLAKKIKDKNTVATVSLWPTGKNLLDFLVIFSMYPAFLFVVYFLHASLPGGFTFISQDIHKKIRGFREDVLMGEDVDYGRRALKAGGVFHLFLSLSALHSPRRARDLGRFGLLLYWWNAHRYAEKFGLVKINGKMKYPYGHYGKSLEERKKLY